MELNNTSTSSNFHRSGRTNNDVSSASNVMLGAFFLNNNNNNSMSKSSSALATDRRAVLDLFSLYAKAVRIIWTYDSTEFCCNADSGKCGYVTNDLETFLRHAADTKRCEACDLHVHHQKDGGGPVLCEKCASSGNTPGVLDMTVERPVSKASSAELTPKKSVNNNKRKRTVSRLSNNSSNNNIPETTFDKAAKRSRISRSKLGTSSNDNAIADLPEVVTSSADLSCSSFSQDNNKPELESANSITNRPQSSSSNNIIANNCGSGVNISGGGGEEELVECNHCGRLLRKESLRTHIARRHENARHHTCQFCDYQSYDAYVMREHVRRHLGQYLFKCDLCPFQAVKKYQLDSHMRRHTGEKPFRCSLCAYACAWNVQLKSHMPLHEHGTDEERAARTCPVCGVLFSSTGTFSRHPCVKGGGGGESTADSAVEVAPKATKKRLLISPPVTEQLVVDLGDNHDNNNNNDQSSHSPNNVILRKRSFRVPLVLSTAATGEQSLSPKLAIPQTASSSSSETIFQLPSVAHQQKQQSSSLQSPEAVEDDA